MSGLVLRFWFIFPFSVVILFLFLAIMITMLILLSMEGSNDATENFEGIDYQCARRNPSTNETTFGIVSIFNDFGQDEYISREDDFGNHLLISNFGYEEYQCTGSCRCDDSVERRNVAVISRGIVYLVAAVSSLLAYEKAKKHFDEECKKRLEEQCSTSAVISETEACERIIRLVRREQEKRNKMSNGRKDIRIYLCKGRCMPSKRLKTEETKNMALEFDCNKLYKEEIIEISEIGHDTSKNMNLLAQQKFQKEELVPFCKIGSVSKYLRQRATRATKEWRKVILCVGSGESKKFRNPSVHCRQIYPEYEDGASSNNLRYW